jgi:hypothetical protein
MGQMRFALIIFSVLLFCAGETLAQSKISPDGATSLDPSLDPAKRISQYVHTCPYRKLRLSFFSNTYRPPVVTVIDRY